MSIQTVMYANDIEQDSRFRCSCGKGEGQGYPLRKGIYIIALSQQLCAILFCFGSILTVAISGKPEKATVLAFNMGLWPHKHYMPIIKMRKAALARHGPDPINEVHVYTAVGILVCLLLAESGAILTLFLACRNKIRPLLFPLMFILCAEIGMAVRTLVIWVQSEEFWMNGAKFIGPLSLGFTNFSIKCWLIILVFRYCQYLGEKIRLNRKPTA